MYAHYHYPVKTRTRLITVRLTEPEYTRLRDHCESNGARSISDYTRQRLIQALTPATEAPISFGHDLATMVQRLTQLRAAIHELQGHIDRICGDADSESKHARQVAQRS